MLLNIVLIVVLFIVFIGCTLLLVFKRHLRSDYEFSFFEDDVIKAEKVNGISNYLFQGNPATQEYINEYVLSERKRKKYFMCEYGKKINSIHYFILAYNSNRKLINVIQVKERRPGAFSRTIKLPRRTRAVNFVIHKVNGFNVDFHPIKKIKLRKIFSYSFLMSAGLFSLVNAVRLLIVITSGYYFYEPYLNTYGTSHFILTGIIASVLFLVLFIMLLIKNRYFTRNRGGFYGKY